MCLQDGSDSATSIMETEEEHAIYFNFEFKGKYQEIHPHYHSWSVFCFYALFQVITLYCCKILAL